MNKDTELFIELINSEQIEKIPQLFLPYAIAIKLQLVDFRPVNEAILNRWSRNALETIKKGAWGIIEYFECIRYSNGFELGRIWLHMDYCIETKNLKRTE